MFLLRTAHYNRETLLFLSQYDSSETPSKFVWKSRRLFNIVCLFLFFPKKFLVLVSYKFFFSCKLPVEWSREGTCNMIATWKLFCWQDINCFVLPVFHRPASRNVFVRTVTGSMRSRCWLRREKLWSSWNWPPKMKNSLKHRRRSKRLETIWIEIWLAVLHGCAIWDLIRKQCCFFCGLGVHDCTLFLCQRDLIMLKQCRENTVSSLFIFLHISSGSTR